MAGQKIRSKDKIFRSLVSNELVGKKPVIYSQEKILQQTFWVLIGYQEGLA